MTNMTHLKERLCGREQFRTEKAVSKLESGPTICFERLHSAGMDRNLFQGGEEEICQIIV